MRGESKVCASCGRAFSWRKRWEKNWNEVRYCMVERRTLEICQRGKVVDPTEARGPIRLRRP